jgi:hypothetical protein
MKYLDITAAVVDKLKDPTLDAMSSSDKTFSLAEGKNVGFTF